MLDVDEARERVVRRMEAAGGEIPDDDPIRAGRTVPGDRMLGAFAGTDLSGVEMLEHAQRETMGVLMRSLAGMSILELVQGLVVRELLFGFELGRMFEQEQSGGGLDA